MEGETQFKHSIKVPIQYKKAAKVLKNSMESNASIKGQIFAEKHAVNITSSHHFKWKLRIIYYFIFRRKRTVYMH